MLCFSPSSHISLCSYSPLPLILVGLIFHSIAIKGILFLLLLQNDQSHPIFCNLCCLLILLSYIWHRELFYTLIFYICCSRQLKVPLVKREWGDNANRSKYYFMIILILTQTFLFSLNFQSTVQKLSSISLFLHQVLKDSGKKISRRPKNISKKRALETKTSRPFSINAYNMQKVPSS